MPPSLRHGLRVGLGEVAGKVFRIGHLGHADRRDGAQRASRPPRCAWRISGWPITLGSGVAAAQELLPARGAARQARRRRRDEGPVRCIIPTFDDMLAAHERIKPHIRRTPILTSDYLNELTGAELFFKCENFQEAGAFKVRGASNAVFGLTEEQAAKGVATHSQRQPRAVAVLCGRAAGHPLQRGDAAHGAAGQEGRGAALWRDDHRMRALDLVARGDLREGAGGDGGRFRPSLQRPARDRGAGHLLQGDDGAGRRARRRRGARSAAAA